MRNPMSDKQTVLIVDDEASIRDMVQLSLELAGFRVMQAAKIAAQSVDE